MDRRRAAILAADMAGYSRLIASDAWIVDGNYHATLDLRLERADTAVFPDTPWWFCAWRAFVRGIRQRPVGMEMPEGCDETAWRRMRDEWWLVWRIWRGRRSERERELGIVSRNGSHVALYVLRSKSEIREFLRAQLSFSPVRAHNACRDNGARYV